MTVSMTKLDYKCVRGQKAPRSCILVIDLMCLFQFKILPFGLNTTPVPFTRSGHTGFGAPIVGGGGEGL